jgi:hypothetical protein
MDIFEWLDTEIIILVGLFILLIPMVIMVFLLKNKFGKEKQESEQTDYLCQDEKEAEKAINDPLQRKYLSKVRIGLFIFLCQIMLIPSIWFFLRGGVISVIHPVIAFIVFIPLTIIDLVAVGFLLFGLIGYSKTYTNSKNTRLAISFWSMYGFLTLALRILGYLFLAEQFQLITFFVALDADIPTVISLLLVVVTFCLALIFTAEFCYEIQLIEKVSYLYISGMASLLFTFAIIFSKIEDTLIQVLAYLMGLVIIGWIIYSLLETTNEITKNIGISVEKSNN